LFNRLRFREGFQENLGSFGEYFLAAVNDGEGSFEIEAL